MSTNASGGAAAHVSPLDDRLPPNDLLRRIYATRQVHDRDEQPQRLSSIEPDYALALYRLVVRLRPAVVVEIGMAQGISALSILTGLEEVGESGRLISIDPFQRRSWKSIGLANVERAGLAHRHTLVEKPSFEALPQLLAEGLVADLAYIDGMHCFDYVFVDFFYTDKLLRAGGIVGFNDCGWRAVWQVIKFMQADRRYEEIDVGLPVRYQGRNALISLARRLLRWPTQDRFFRKLQRWERLQDGLTGYEREALYGRTGRS